MIKAEERIREVTGHLKLSRGLQRKNNKSEESPRELWDNIKRTYLSIVGIPEGKEKKKGTESLFKETMAEAFPSLGRDLDIHICKTHRSPERSFPRQI